MSAKNGSIKLRGRHLQSCAGAGNRHSAALCPPPRPSIRRFADIGNLRRRNPGKRRVSDVVHIIQSTSYSGQRPSDGIADHHRRARRSRRAACPAVVPCYFRLMPGKDPQAGRARRFGPSCVANLNTLGPIASCARSQCRDRSMPSRHFPNRYLYPRSRGDGRDTTSGRTSIDLNHFDGVVSTRVGGLDARARPRQTHNARRWRASTTNARERSGESEVHEP